MNDWYTGRVISQPRSAASRPLWNRKPIARFAAGRNGNPLITPVWKGVACLSHCPDSSTRSSGDSSAP